MKISDLSKIDVKDIDIAKIQELALQHKEKVFQGVLAFVSFIVAMTFFINSQMQISGYKSKMNALLAKTDSISEYNQSQSDIKNYLKEVPEFVSEDKIVALITDLAGQNGIKIVTFSAANTEKKGGVEAIVVEFTLSADSFIQMVQFVSAIERGKNLLQVWSCVAEPQQDVKNIMSGKKGIPVNFRIQVASLKVIS